MPFKEVIIIYKVEKVDYKNIKQYIYLLLENEENRLPLNRIFHISIMALIFFNVLFVILGTVDDLAEIYGAFFNAFEDISVIIFTIEYLMRLWSCTSNAEYRHPLIGRMKFAFSPMMLIDLFAILPFYIPLFIDSDFTILRVFRLLRIFCLFKLGRYSDSYRLISRVIISKKEHLIVSLALVFSLLIISSSLMYYIEKEAQPAVFSSIPATMWWGIVTLTTVGYGDAYPVTLAGKILSGAIALTGIGLFALPAGLLATGFTEELHNKKKKQRTCPYFEDIGSCPIHRHIEAVATTNTDKE